MNDNTDAKRDDAGRTDDSTGFDIQARMFTGIGAFLFLLSIVYGLVSKEAAGTTMLVLAGALSTLTAAYLGVIKPASEISVDAVQPSHAGADRGDTGAIDAPWFPHASIWPFTIGLGAVLVANGLLLGLWFALPAAVVLGAAIYGFAVQSRHRS